MARNKVQEEDEEEVEHFHFAPAKFSARFLPAECRIFITTGTTAHREGRKGGGFLLSHHPLLVKCSLGVVGELAVRDGGRVSGHGGGDVDGVGQQPLLSCMSGAKCSPSSVFLVGVCSFGKAIICVRLFRRKYWICFFSSWVALLYVQQYNVLRLRLHSGGRGGGLHL